MSVVDRPIHRWFGLTYAHYLVLPRSVLQEMPTTWQEKFCALLDELPNLPTEYTVQARNERGRFIEDPLANYKYSRVTLVDGEVVVHP